MATNATVRMECTVCRKRSTQEVSPVMANRGSMARFQCPYCDAKTEGHVVETLQMGA